MSHYLDTSILVPLFVRETRSKPIQQWVAKGGRRLHIADLVATEFSAVISRLVRQRMLSDHEAAAIRTQFERWREYAANAVENLPCDIRAAGILVRSPLPRLLAADATHLATCRRLDLTLVTHDTDLQSIATREGVRWENPT